MMEHVSGGVFPPASYRVVGDPFAGQGRTELVLELHPQPTASLDFVGALEDAGHNVSRRWADGRLSFGVGCLADRLWNWWAAGSPI